MRIFRKRQVEPPPVVISEPPGSVRRSILVNVYPVRLPGDLVVPAEAFGIVVFAHGSGSSRRSPRNIEVAEHLNDAGMGTLLFDLLTQTEAEDRANVFDIGLLAERLVAAQKWLRTWPGLGSLPVGLFGASTGAAAALVAASRLRVDVAAIVSRGGRPDLAGEDLEQVTAPTLLIVGGDDVEVLAMNREAERKLRCEKRVEVVSGATHLFEEPGALEEVSRLAAEWFAKHLAEAGHGRRLTLTGLLG
jgi:putative phosphoribosyl transferase